MRKILHPFTFATTLAMCLLGGLGCTSTVYVVDLTPTDKGMRRTFTVDEVSGNNRHARQVKSADRTRLLDAYGLDLADDAPLPKKLSGVFVGRMPEDVGGYGSYHQLESPHGIARFYTERFRGSLDLTDTLQRRRESLDQAINLIHRWSHHQWPTSGELPDRGGGIASWIDTTFRNDLQNLLLVTWTHSAANEIVQGSGDLTKSISASYMAYLGQYAAEHDYLQWDEIPSLFHAVKTNNNDATLKIIRQVLLRKLKQSTGRDYQDELQIVLEPDRLKKSLQVFLKSTDEYASLVRQRHPVDEYSDSKAVEVEPIDLISQPLLEAFIPGFIWARDRVEVQLHLDGPPDHTNGVWDPQDESLQWNRPLNSGPIPTLAFAVWTTPDAEFQTRIFGETIVDGDALAMHATWYAGLKKPDQRRWKDLLEAFAKQRVLEPEQSSEDVFQAVVENADLVNFPSLMTEAERTKELL